MDVTKTYKSIGFGDIHGPKPYQVIGFRWALLSQTQVLCNPKSPARADLTLRLEAGVIAVVTCRHPQLFVSAELRGPGNL